MNTSESIAKLAEALCLAQGQMTGAKKDSKNPFFKSNYSDLASVMSAMSQPFADNGLSFIQSPSFADNLVTVTTRLIHKSGEWIEGTVCLPPTKNDAQGYGSAITYGKRYGLQAMVGVPSVDDDGQAATLQAVPVYTKTNPKPIPDSLQESVTAIKFGITNNDLSIASEAWTELTKDEKQELWTAPSKGGCFTTQEREVMKSTEFRVANGVQAA